MVSNVLYVSQLAVRKINTHLLLAVLLNQTETTISVDGIYGEALLMVQPKHCRIRKFYAGCLVCNAVSNEYRKNAKIPSVIAI